MNEEGNHKQKTDNDTILLNIFLFTLMGLSCIANIIGICWPQESTITAGVLMTVTAFTIFYTFNGANVISDLVLVIQIILLLLMFVTSCWLVITMINVLHNELGPLICVQFLASIGIIQLFSEW